MNGVARDAEDRSLGEILVQNGQPSCGYDTGESESRSRMEAEAFVDACIKVWKPFDLLSGCDYFVFGFELLVEFPVELVLSATVFCEVVKNGTRGARW